MPDYLDFDLTEVAYREIKKMVGSGDLLPGEKIKPNEIINRLEISNTPTISALKRLVGEGFIEHRSRKGYFVKEYTELQLIEFLQLRAALESIAIRLLIERNCRSDINKILTFWNGIVVEDDQNYTLNDIRFHELIVSLCGNRHVYDVWMKSGYNFNTNQKELQNTFKDSREDHRKLLKAVRERDGEEAQLVMAEHFMRRARQGLLKYSDVQGKGPSGPKAVK